MDCYLYKKPICDPSKTNEVISSQTNPGIVHFAGYFKPWNFECTNPYKEYYDKSLYGTIWENYKKEFKERSIMKIMKLILKRIIKGSLYFK